MGSNERFAELVQETFGEMVERNPLLATYLGNHDADHRLPNPSPERVREDFLWFRRKVAKFDALGAKGLHAENRLDLQLLHHYMALETFWYKDAPNWQRDPDALQGIGSVLFLQFTREYAPWDERCAAIAARLRALPGYLKAFRRRIKTPVRLWTEMAIESSQHLPRFFEHMVSGSRGKVSRKVHAELTRAVAMAKKACKEQEAWLRRLLPKANARWALGPAKFRKLIALRELGLGVEAIRALGHRLLKDLKRRREKLAGQIMPGKSVDEVTRTIKASHPATFAQALEVYVEVMEESRAFIEKHGIATIPTGEQLMVMETPVFMVPVIPFAAYFSPAKFDPVQTGIYLVSPSQKGTDMMVEHNYPSIHNTTVHEGYPGHHLQLSSANLRAPLARFLGFFCDTATETVEGWAHYCEEMMKEYGFYDNPESRYIMVNDGIWRAVRILVDVGLSRGEMTFDQAVDMLVRETGMERAGAVAEVKRYTQSPGYQLSYLLGKQLFFRLRKDVRRKMGNRYSDKFFHDTILGAGSIPLAYIRKLFGIATARKKPFEAERPTLVAHRF